MIIKISEFLIISDINFEKKKLITIRTASFLYLLVIKNILQSLSFASVLDSICNYLSYSYGEVLTLPCSHGIYQQWPQFYIWYFSGQPKDPSWALAPSYFQQSYLLLCHLINSLQQITRCTRRPCLSLHVLKLAVVWQKWSLGFHIPGQAITSDISIYLCEEHRKTRKADESLDFQ